MEKVLYLQILMELCFLFIKNQNKELNYFQYGFSMKASAIRLADSFLIISKTQKELSIGIISKRLQKKSKKMIIF